MENNNKPILDQLIRKAFPQVSHLNYKLTEYSLNSTFSFKFDHLPHFIEFLEKSQTLTEQHNELLNKTLKDLNLETTSFFFINFFEEDEVASS